MQTPERPTPNSQPTTSNAGIALITVALLIACCLLPPAFSQGPLTPPGPPGPTFKTLGQIEPRTPVTNLPYTISQPGSYYVVSNLTGATGITISAGDVTLDLMGFTLIGGSGDGVAVAGVLSNITVRNGTVRNWSGNGVGASLAQNVLLLELHASKNGGAGLVGGSSDSLIRRCIATGNTRQGINVIGPDCSVMECLAAGNGMQGILATQGCLVATCNVFSNGFGGIKVGEGSTVRDCVARLNAGVSGDPGIQTGDSCTIISSTVQSNGALASIHYPALQIGNNCTIKDCTSSGNAGIGIETQSGDTVSGCSAGANTANGIRVINGSTVSGCTVRLNKHSGIVLGASNTVKDNTLDSNGLPSDGNIEVNDVANRIENNHCIAAPTGILLYSSRNVIIRNTLGYNTSPISIPVTPNFYGAPIKTNNLVQGINVISTNPWSNFEYGP